MALLLHSDAAASGRRQLTVGAQQVALVQPAGLHAGSVPAVQRSKIALLFLTQGPVMPLAPVWQLFLSSLDGAGGWQSWFSLYSHPPPGAAYPAGSLFAGTEVPEGRVRVEWGQPSVVEAERVLLRAALRDPANQRFLFLSESCVPLYPAPAVYLQLLAERSSRVWACANASDPEDVRRRMDFRWSPAMAAAGVERSLWRKSAQWAALQRRHAELVAEETEVFTVFRRHCQADPGRDDGYCIADEHYVPTLLAVKGLAGPGEVGCDATLTHTRWDADTSHPHTYSAQEATADVLGQEMRGDGCDAGLLLRLAKRAVAGNGSGLAEGHSAPAPLPQRCPLFARKIDKTALAAWLDLLRPVLLV